MAALIEAQIKKQFCRTDRDLRQLKRVEKWREHKAAQGRLSYLNGTDRQIEGNIRLCGTC